MLINLSVAKVFFVFLSIITLPSLMYVSLNASSMAAGILVTCFIIALTVGRLRVPIAFLSLPVAFFFSVVVVYVVYIASLGGLSLKHCLSVFLLSLMFVCAAWVALAVVRIESGNLIFVLKLLCVGIVLIGYMSIFFPVTFSNYSKFAKSIFPFSEPSHYAITVSGILLAAGFYLSFKQRVLLVVSVLFFAVIYPSTLLLLLVLIMLFSYYAHSVFKVLCAFIILGMVVVLVTYAGVDLSYYEDRLKLNQSTSNLTALVYLQGWNDAYRAFFSTNGLGLGFQNLGSLAPGDIGEKIYQLSGIYKNREDGGFLAAKLIGEFGVFGLALLCLYVFSLFKAALYNLEFFKIYKMDRAVALHMFPAYSIFGSSLVVAFSIELFARGYGYFSPGVLLVMVAFFLKKKQKVAASDRNVLTIIGKITRRLTINNR